MNRIDYRERLGRARTYMHQHLAEDLDIQTLANASAMSAYHWHRLYHAYYGETAAATVRRLRLQHAAGLLAQTTLPVHDIAAQSGYANLQSFTRLFRDAHGMPPAAYRKHGSHTPFETTSRDIRSDAYDIRIEQLAPFQVITCEHVGPYMGIAEAFDRLYGWLIAHDVSPASARHFGIFPDDPHAPDESNLRSYASVAVPNPPKLPDEFAWRNVCGGACVTLRYRGPYSSMHAAYRWLFGVWVVDSGYEVADAPLVEEYLNDPATTPPTELLTDIRMMLRQPPQTCRMIQPSSTDTGNVSTDSSSSSGPGSTVTS